MKTIRKTLAVSLAVATSLMLTAAVVSAQSRDDALPTSDAEPLGYLPLSEAVVKAALADLDGSSS